jgi:hypothetical protein
MGLIEFVVRLRRKDCEHSVSYASTTRRQYCNEEIHSEQVTPQPLGKANINLGNYDSL